jgi:ubiquinone/menaquinone biosynthesis C-methylase UbiE
MAANATLFDRWSASYDRPNFQNTTYRPVHDAVLARIGEQQPRAILDLGCGTGQLTTRLIERFPKAVVVGADYSPGMLAEARTRLGESALLVRADAQTLPLAESSVDIVVCTESFHWYQDQAKALAGLAAILRPGGQLIIASIATVTRVGGESVRKLSSLTGQPVRALPPQQLRELLGDAGFDVAYQRRIPRMGLVPWPVLTDGRLR